MAWQEAYGRQHSSSAGRSLPVRAGQPPALLLGESQTRSVPPMSKRSAVLARLGCGALFCLAPLLLAGCERKVSEESRRLDQLDLKIQQLESRLNRLSIQKPPSGPQKGDSKLPAGAIKSLTYRTTPASNRLRIYWADGSQSDLECTQEQATLACG